MERFVVSRYLAERLKQAGFSQQTEFMWCRYSLGGWSVLHSDIGKDLKLAVSSGERLEEMAAPMTDELLEHLPKVIGLCELVIYPHDHSVTAQYEDVEDVPPMGAYPPRTRFVDELAEVWLWCKDNGYLELA